MKIGDAIDNAIKNAFRGEKPLATIEVDYDLLSKAFAHGIRGYLAVNTDERMLEFMDTSYICMIQIEDIDTTGHYEGILVTEIQHVMKELRKVAKSGDKVTFYVYPDKVVISCRDWKIEEKPETKETHKELVEDMIKGSTIILDIGAIKEIPTLSSSAIFFEFNRDLYACNLLEGVEIIYKLHVLSSKGDINDLFIEYDCSYLVIPVKAKVTEYTAYIKPDAPIVLKYYIEGKLTRLVIAPILGEKEKLEEIRNIVRTYNGLKPNRFEYNPAMESLGNLVIQSMEGRGYVIACPVSNTAFIISPLQYDVKETIGVDTKGILNHFIKKQRDIEYRGNVGVKAYFGFDDYLFRFACITLSEINLKKYMGMYKEADARMHVEDTHKLIKKVRLKKQGTLCITIVDGITGFSYIYEDTKSKMEKVNICTWHGGEGKASISVGFEVYSALLHLMKTLPEESPACTFYLNDSKLLTVKAGSITFLGGCYVFIGKSIEDLQEFFGKLEGFIKTIPVDKCITVGFEEFLKAVSEMKKPKELPEKPEEKPPKKEIPEIDDIYHAFRDTIIKEKNLTDEQKDSLLKDLDSVYNDIKSMFEGEMITTEEAISTFKTEVEALRGRMARMLEIVEKKEVYINVLPREVQSYLNALKLIVVGEVEVRTGVTYYYKDRKVYFIPVLDNATGNIVRIVYPFPYRRDTLYKLVTIYNAENKPVSVLALGEDADKVLPVNRYDVKKSEDVNANVELVTVEKVKPKEIPFHYDEFKRHIFHLKGRIASMVKFTEEKKAIQLYEALENLEPLLVRMMSEMESAYVPLSDIDAEANPLKITREEKDRLWKYFVNELRKEGIDGDKYRARFERVLIEEDYETNKMAVDELIKTIILEEEWSKYQPTLMNMQRIKNIVNVIGRFRWKPVNWGVNALNVYTLRLEVACNNHDFFQMYELLRNMKRSVVTILSILELNSEVRKWKGLE